MDKLFALKRYFGYDGFREGQEPLIDALLSGRDALGIMPTGGGKSLCYQIPALLLPGVTLVISPLISLMKDQVAALKKAGVDAAFLNSSLTGEQQSRVYSRALQGAYKLLYIAPERLETERFAALMRSLPVSLVAVDEAHCISQWGQDFRPSYLKIADFVHSLPQRPPVAAFTATATQRVQKDIVRLLELHEPLSLVTGFDRPNLFLDVLRPSNKQAELLRLLHERPGRSGIVYCATRQTVERVCGLLQEAGFPATRYHAGLDEQERRENQEAFQFDSSRIMVATNAFGMGIDKSNVSFVIHYNMPKSLEAYYQEAGRAGRDGEPADCILLYAAADVVTARFLIDNSGDGLSGPDREQVQREDLARLERMIGYCKTTGCLRGYLLDYFGQAHEPGCGHCGNCGSLYESLDITRQAQMILSCLYRVRERLGYDLGATRVVEILRGSENRQLRELGLDRLSTYGLMKQNSRKQVRAMIDCLEQEGYLRSNPEHRTLEPTAAAARVLFRGETVQQLTRIEVRPKAAKAARTEHTAFKAQDEGLLGALRATRLQIAREEGVPAYLVFSNATLADMAEKAPDSEAAFLEVTGVGAVKAARYGAQFLRAIAQYRASGEAKI